MGGNPFQESPLDIPNKASLLRGRIGALGRKLGINVEGMLPPDRGYADPKQADAHYFALTALHDRLQSKVDETEPTGPPTSTLDARENIPGEVMGGTRHSTEYVPRRPAGETAGQRADREAPAKAVKGPSQYKGKRVTPQGFLTPDEREKIKRELAEGVTGGRDDSKDKARRRYLMGNMMGKAVTGTWGAYGMKGMSQINRNIMENEKLAEDEFQRPERLRKERMGELLAAIGDDSELGALMRKRSLGTVDIDGQTMDPDIAARNPQLFQESDSQAIGAADPEMGDIVSRSMATKQLGDNAAASLKSDKTRAEIAKLEAEAAYKNAKAEGKTDEQAKILADRIKKEALKKLDELKDGPLWFENEVSPEDMPLGLDQYGMPDEDLLQALASLQLKGRMTGINGETGIPR